MKQYEFTLFKNGAKVGTALVTAPSQSIARRALVAKYAPEFVVAAFSCARYPAHHFYNETDASDCA